VPTTHRDGEIGVRFSSGAWVYPHPKVFKRFINGHEDSLKQFYDVTSKATSSSEIATSTRASVAR
jgi:hypothetical protein